MEGEKNVRVVLTRPEGRPLRYTRPLAGMTVAEAIEALESSERPLGLPEERIMLPPYSVNREIVDWDSTRVLQPGDVFRADDP